MSKRLPGLAAAVAMLFVVLLHTGCGGYGDSPTSPTSSSSTPTVASCSSVSFRSQSFTVACSIPGQAQQPTGVQLTPSSGVCLFVTCSAGCASAVRTC
jgi:hypothetical protein